MSTIAIDSQFYNLGSTAMDQALAGANVESGIAITTDTPTSIWRSFTSFLGDTWGSFSDAEQVAITAGAIATTAQFVISKAPILSTIVLPGVITDFMASSANLINEAQNGEVRPSDITGALNGFASLVSGIAAFGAVAVLGTAAAGTLGAVALVAGIAAVTQDWPRLPQLSRGVRSVILGLDVSISISFTDFNAKNDFYMNFPRV